MLSGVHRDTIVQTVHPHKYKGMHYKVITDGAVTHQMCTLPLRISIFHTMHEHY